jgi:RHS repeat-associated protein
MIIYNIILFPFLAKAQTPTNTENYVRTKNYKQPTATTIPIPTPIQATQSITYYDGLGRPIQQLAHAQSNSGKDIVIPIEYDAFGRQVKEYLPFASSQNTMAYMDSTTLKQNLVSQYQTQYGESIPFSEKRYESSPLNRLIDQAAPGNDWAMGSGHEVKFDYQTNSITDSIKLYNANTTWNSALGLYEINLVNAGVYSQNQLYVSITKDENWDSGNMNTVREFKNKEGRVVLKRTYDNSFTHDTYYVYDQFGNLTYVIPPKANASITTAVLDELCYQYKYDARNRLVEKKLPGKQWEFIVYDKLDRVVMTGPTKPPFRHLTNLGWMFTKYDDFNRVIMTGWMTSSTINSSQRKIKQDERDAQTIFSESRLVSGTTASTAPSNANNPTHSYTNVALPTTGYYILTINYYDDYNYVDAPIDFTNVLTQPVYYNNTIKPKGLLTGKWVKVLDLTTSQASSKKQTSYIFYDYKGRVIRNYIKNYESSPGWTQTDTKLDFEGKVEYTVTSHRRTTADPAALTATDYFTYTNQSRLLSHTQKINTGTIQLISENSYDELGQLISKKVGNTTNTPLQKVDYTYNIRGWLNSINNDPTDNLVLNSAENDLFSFKINYNNVQNGINYIGKKLYNGNIAETFWKSSSNNIMRKYGYLYDGLNRLTNAFYLKPGSSEPEPGTYNESVTYDNNGNILTLKRNGGNDGAMPEQEIDNLTYLYANNNNSNRLVRVSENYSNAASGFIDGTNTGDDYTYDDYGNMLTDQNKGITNIRYNHLNLPMEIAFANNDKISYVYDGSGNKLEKNVSQGTTVITTKYIEGFQYKKVGANSDVLQFFPTAEGYVKKVGTSSYGYVFNYTDHLGNIRMSYQDLNLNGTISTNEILEENHYYPFGLKHSYTNTAVSDYKYKYSGKEYQDELGLNMYDYGARNYDPAIGRWMNIDPLAEKMRRYSPYSFTFNNPLRFIDPDGMSPTDVILMGSEKQKAFTELQKSVQGQLNLSMDSGGKVTYSAVQGATINANSQQLVNAIDDHSINVNVKAENTFATSNHNYYEGGAFMGNTVTSNVDPASDKNIVEANQEINPNVLDKLSTAYNKPGADTLHEVTEAYQGAKLSQTSGVSSPQAGLPGSVYTQAHSPLATPQSGAATRTLFDAQGNILQPVTNTPTGFPNNTARIEVRANINNALILQVP